MNISIAFTNGVVSIREKDAHRMLTFHIRRLISVVVQKNAANYYVLTVLIEEDDPYDFICENETVANLLRNDLAHKIALYEESM